MKHNLRKKTNKNKKYKKRQNKQKTRKHIRGAGIMDTYNAINKTSQGFYNMYLGAKDKYQNMMQQYKDVENKYQEMKQTLERIKNDPEVQQHLNTLSNLNFELQQSIQSTTPPPPPPEQVIQNAGFFDTSKINASLQSGLQSANTYYSTKKQQAQKELATAKSVYNDPKVKQNISDLTKHSKDTLKQGTLFGVNVATASPISATYRGYNTYQSAKKGVSSAKDLYKTASDVYSQSSIPVESPQTNIPDQQV